MEYVEFVEAFFSDASLRKPEPFRRFFENNNRYYLDSNGEIRIGITSFLSAVLPTAYYLEAWKKEVGEKRAAEILRERADYGTAFHILCSSVLRAYITTIKYEIPLTDYEIQQSLHLYGIITSDKNLSELSSDMAAFAEFCETYKPRAILLETPLASHTTKLAATLDFFGYITISVKGFYGEVYKSGDRKGEAKETTQTIRSLALIDFKTMIKKHGNEGENKAISNSNELQLNYQKLFLLENYPEYKDKEIKMYNAIPKNWISNPEMQMTEIKPIPVTALNGLYEISKYINPYIIEKLADKKMTVINSYNGNIKDCVKTVSFKEYINSKFKKL